MRRARPYAEVLAVVACLSLYFAMAMHGVRHKSGTYDEFVHVTSGYSYSAYDDYRLNAENGNLPQRLMALPLLASGPEFPSLDQPAWQASDMWGLADQYFFAPGRDADAMLRAARRTIALVGVLLGLAVFFWSRSLFGRPGAYLSLVVFVFTPALLAHGALATSDMTGAAFFTVSVWALWTVLHRVTPLTIAASTLAAAGLFVSKLSAVLLVPIALVMVLVRVTAGRGRPLIVRAPRGEREIREPGRMAIVIGALAALHVVVCIVVIWGFYGFRFSAFSAHLTGHETFIVPWSDVLRSGSLPSALASWGRDHRVLPEAYLFGLASVDTYSKVRNSFLNGVVSPGGSHWFFPYAALVKTTLPALALVALMPFALVRRRRFYELTPLVALIVIYGVFAVQSALDIGDRHLLPLIPAVIILMGAIGTVRLPGRRKIAAASVVGALLAWHVGESIWIAPDYLAYFNELNGGPSRAYRHLVDSSLDWGQDLPGLKTWLDREGLQGQNHLPVYLSYFGTSRPEFYRIDARMLPSEPDRWTPHLPEPLVPGTYCISATMLQSVYSMARGAWTPDYESNYQSILYDLHLFDSTAVNPSARAALLRQTGEEFWVKAFHTFEQYRFARLAAALRKREPDAEVGHSILIYRVSESELDRALVGPAP